MKLLDKYIAKNFLVSYVISFAVLIGMRIMIDLFMNVDEFTEHESLGFLAVAGNILSYYAIHTSLYFRDFAGMITVFAATFSVSRLVRSRELIAVMASGVSLKRVIVPIIVLALVLTGVQYIDQEFIIPPLGPKLIRSHDVLPGEETYDVDFIADANGALICAFEYDAVNETLIYPAILTRKRIGDTLRWTVTGRISAEKAVYDRPSGKWELIDGSYTEKSVAQPPKPIEYFATDIKPADIPIRQKAQYNTLLSSGQISQLIASGTKIKDVAQLLSQKQFRITDLIINLVMLLVALPILVCRDPRTMKSAIAISFTITGLCFITTFVCKMVATEIFFSRVMPEFWAWLPVFIFAPIAFVELDSMKT